MTTAEAAALLGVTADASIADVQHAYQRAARRTHPDLMGGDDDPRVAGARFAVLNEARDTLLRSHPVIPVRFEPLRQEPKRKGIGGSVVILLLLAAALVASVTLADSYRTQTVENLRGGVVQTP
ncbi:J domain-containing protein [Herbiconiux sp. L3-i23]|uniref:J domain-containing protein n=1 Tax=Herbiconiux sp. L3-i23 TaxID=2905871 RepID=UPI002065E288|nr:J domain-containing protein [Herbiconiux sp. L3-i23]BDI22899.1 hypothetical protein L3i23_16750 [Herbiconiux sp. L3-i23]